jgi:hypothetical protein
MRLCRVETGISRWAPRAPQRSGHSLDDGQRAVRIPLSNITGLEPTVLKGLEFMIAMVRNRRTPGGTDK